MQHRGKLDEKGNQITDELWAILDEHLPPDLVKVAKEKVEALQANVLDMCDHTDKRLYRALVGFLPEHEGEIHAAIAGTLFDGSVCDEKALAKWAGGVEWAISPREFAALTGSGPE
jgi:hypothetical protein